MVSPLYGVSCSPSFAAYSPETTASAWFSSDFGHRVAPPASLFFVLSTLPSVHGDAAAHVFFVIGRVRISVGDFEALHCDVFGVLQQDGLADARTGDDGRGAFAVRSDGDGRVLGAFGVDDAQAGLDRGAVDGLVALVQVAPALSSRDSPALRVMPFAAVNELNGAGLASAS